MRSYVQPYSCITIYYIYRSLVAVFIALRYLLGQCRQPTHGVRLPVQTYEMRKHLVKTFPWLKTEQNAAAILQTYEIFIYGDIHYSTDSFCSTNVLK